MSPTPVTALRERLLEDMAVRHFGEKSAHDYLRHIDRFLAFLGRAPETATVDDLRNYQVHGGEKMRGALTRTTKKPMMFGKTLYACPRRGA